MKSIVTLLSLLFLYACGATPPAQTTQSPEPAKTTSKSADLKDHLKLLNQWFPGEYNNHEQVWLQKGLKEDVVFNHVHHIFYPLDAPKVGQSVYYVEQALAESKKVFRQRIYVFSIDQKAQAIRLDIFKFNDEKAWRGLHLTPERASSLTTQDLKEVKGCEVYWKYQADQNHFTGEMIKDQCRIKSSWSKKTMIINDDLILDDHTVYIRDVAKDESGKILFGHPDLPHYRNVKVSYFTGWATVRPLGENTPLNDGKDYGWNLHKGIQIHSEGDKVKLIGSKGKDLGYSIQLARVTRPGSKTELIKLSIINDETKKTKSYVWTDPKANRVGMNIGWAQVGLTLEAKTPYFGFDTPQEEDLLQLIQKRFLGSFSSEAQAQKNQAYSNDQVSFCSLKIKGSAHPALLMEYKSQKAKNRSSFVYQIAKQGKDQIRFDRLTLKKGTSVQCQDQKASPSELNADQLEAEKGCEITFNYINRIFVGSTQKKKCNKNKEGSEYEHVDLRMVKNTLYYWRRGVKEIKGQKKGEILWGSKEGAYQFERLGSQKAGEQAGKTAKTKAGKKAGK